MYIDSKSGIKIEYFGESHSPTMELHASGIEKDIEISEKELNDLLERRRPKIYGETSRHEKDEYEFLSGIEDFKTTGEEIIIRVKNSDVNKKPYSEFNGAIRPSTADYPSAIKYGEKYLSGGGKFSARLTVLTCLIGGILLQALEKKGVKISAEVCSVGKINTNPYNPVTGEKTTDEKFIKKAQAEIKKAANKKDSLGGEIECVIKGVPIGTGDADFDGLEGKISETVFSIPSVKGIEFGSGFLGAKKTGKENNDNIIIDGGRISTEKNDAGGILGGMANGMPITMRVAFKPIPSIGISQKTVNIKTGEETLIKIKGRHDACAVFRATPIVESAAAIAIYSAMRLNDTDELSKKRLSIDEIDKNISSLLAKRYNLVKEIGNIKKESGKKIEDKSREKEVLEKVTAPYTEEKEYITNVYKGIFSASKREEK